MTWCSWSFAIRRCRFPECPLHECFWAEASLDLAAGFYRTCTSGTGATVLASSWVRSAWTKLIWWRSRRSASRDWGSCRWRSTSFGNKAWSPERDSSGSHRSGRICPGVKAAVWFASGSTGSHTHRSRSSRSSTGSRTGRAACGRPKLYLSPFAPCTIIFYRGWWANRIHSSPLEYCSQMFPPRYASRPARRESGSGNSIWATQWKQKSNWTLRNQCFTPQFSSKRSIIPLKIAPGIVIVLQSHKRHTSDLLYPLCLVRRNKELLSQSVFLQINLSQRLAWVLLFNLILFSSLLLLLLPPSEQLQWFDNSVNLGVGSALSRCSTSLLSRHLPLSVASSTESLVLSAMHTTGYFVANCCKQLLFVFINILINLLIYLFTYLPWSFFISLSLLNRWGACIFIWLAQLYQIKFIRNLVFLSFSFMSNLGKNEGTIL